MPGERGASPGVYDNWAGGYSGYADRGRTAQQNASQTGTAP